MTEKAYRFKFDEYGNTREIYVYASGQDVQNDSFVNKGTAFTEEDRRRLGLGASLPPAVRTLGQQVANSRVKVDSKNDDIERFIYIRSLFDRNVTLAHALIKSDLERYLLLIFRASFCV
jgi:malate dehydrogenase (oxaloacetate-decarboxylating)